jgi:hypothetical protein
MISIATKIAKISYEIGALKKDKSDKVNYDFHGYESVNAKLKALLHHYNLALIPEITEVVEKEFFIKSYDQYKKIEVEKMLIRTTVKGFINVVCGDTGDIFKASFCGADQDYGGKSFGQAVTEMVKRFELKLFHISTKQDVDPDSRSDVYEHDAPESKKAESKKQPITEDRYCKALLLIEAGEYSKEEFLAKFDVDPAKVEQDLTNLKGE